MSPSPLCGMMSPESRDGDSALLVPCGGFCCNSKVEFLKLMPMQCADWLSHCLPIGREVCGEAAMITGIVTTSIETTIRLKVRVSVTNGQEHEIEAVVDTGFNGFLTLPSALMTSLGLPTRGARQATVADGRTVRLDVDYENPSSLILHRLFDES